MFNKSKTYLLPLLFKEMSVNSVYTRFVRNTYLQLKDYDFERNIIILEVEQETKEGKKELEVFKELLYGSKNFDSSYYTSNIEVFIMKILKYTQEYDMFLIGKYSKFNNHPKVIITRHWQEAIKSEKFNRDVSDVLYQNKRLRNELEQKLAVTLPEDAELSSICNMELETINYE